MTRSRDRFKGGSNKDGSNKNYGYKSYGSKSYRRTGHTHTEGQLALYRRLLIVAPVLILLVLSGLLLVPASTAFAQWLLEENRPVELLTCLVAFLTAIVSFKLSRAHHRKQHRLAAIFYGVVALLFFLFAMEEISWGQQLLGFSTPEFWRVRNAQDELTLHNYDYPGVVYLEAYPLMAGVIGLLAIAAGAIKKLPKALCPSLLLFSWFAAIALHSGIDLFHEFYIPFPAFDTLINHLDEAAEMLTAMAGFLYVYLNADRLKRARREPEESQINNGSTYI